MIRNLPEKWDLEADVVAIGSGIGGLAAAITAHENGASAIVLERSEQVGGVTALSQGQVWIAGNHHARELGIEDSAESGFRYLKRLSMDYGEDVAILNKVVHARVALKYFEDKIGLEMFAIRNCPDYYYGLSNDSVAEGRMLEVKPFPGNSLGEWQSRTRLSPQVPTGLTSQEIADKGGLAAMPKWDYALMGERLTRDERCAGSGLAAYFVKGVIDRGIPMHTGVNAEELIGDGERIAGVRATRDGEQLFIKANRGVVIAVSSYERDRKSGYNKMLGQPARPGIDAVLDDRWRPFPAGRVHSGHASPESPRSRRSGFQVPGEEDEEGQKLWRSAHADHRSASYHRRQPQGQALRQRSVLPLVLLHDRRHRRRTQTHPNFPCWVVMDSQARRNTVHVDHARPGLAGRARRHRRTPSPNWRSKIGIDAEGLNDTVASFNSACRKGRGSGVRPGQAALERLDVRRQGAQAEPQSRSRW